MIAGQLSSVITCKICGNTSTCWDPFWDLSLPLPRGQERVSIERCISAFEELEELRLDEKPVCHIRLKSCFSDNTSWSLTNRSVTDVRNRYQRPKDWASYDRRPFSFSVSHTHTLLRFNLYLTHFSSPCDTHTGNSLPPDRHETIHERGIQTEYSEAGCWAASCFEIKVRQQILLPFSLRLSSRIQFSVWSLHVLLSLRWPLVPF